MQEMSVPGPTRTSQHVRFFAARGGEADISRRMQTDTIYEYAPYADEYTLFDCLDRLLQQCEDYGLQMSVVQGGADEADAIARRL